MIREPLIFVATSDLAGKTRGKAFPEADRDKRMRRGMGWVPTNAQITCFDSIAETPFGALGDLFLVPDVATEISVDYQDGSVPERLVMGDILTTDGTPWAFCTRGILKAALARLEAVAGAQLQAAFEHEFQFAAGSCLPMQGFGYGGHAEKAAFGETLTAALRQSGQRPDSFICEYGVDQFEVTVAPQQGLKAADDAVILREVTRATARRFEQPVTFTPIRDIAGVGNGVHIHMSLHGDKGPLTHDPDGPGGMSDMAASFAAGILKYAENIIALTAPSVISYQRLTPHRWSAAFNNLGLQDREATLRICPTSATDTDAVARQFNLEFRAADAAASPHLALAALIHAGCQGIEEGLMAPEITTEDLSLLNPEQLNARGLVRLPTSLAEALQRFGADTTVQGWFPDGFVALYRDHKLGEIAYVEGLDVAAQCAAYEKAY